MSVRRRLSLREGSPWPRVAAIYALSLPLAWALTPAAWRWDFVAALIATVLVPVASLGSWWLAINALFLPALSTALSFDIDPLWAAAGLTGLLLVYGRIWTSRVPLFFSTRRTRQALVDLVPAGVPLRFLDVGCGDARVLAGVAAARPHAQLRGIEQAWLPWLLARLRCASFGGRCTVRRADFWRSSLRDDDVVYAFLSPEVMPAVWEKARREMRPGTLFISAFAVPGTRAQRVVDVGDALGTQLHVWRMV